MLRELHISNLAIIEDIRLELRDGLNTFTGQTGAGKSLVLGAFELLLGRRATSDLVRPGATEGRVIGVFDIDDPEIRRSVAVALDGPTATDLEEDEIIITRRISASGRNSAAINGRPVPASTLRDLGERLIDLHAATEAGARAVGEHAFLLRPANQLALLDAFAGAEEAREAISAIYDRWRSLRDERERLESSQSLRREKLELLRFQADDIDRIEPTDGEYDELQARHDVLANLSRLRQDGASIYAALYDADGAVVERLQAMVGLLRTMDELDPALREVSELTESATASLQEAAFTLNRFLGRLEVDADEIGEVSDRLNALNRLIAKYGAGGGLDGVLEARARIGEEINELETAERDGVSLDGEIDRLAAEWRRRAEELSEVRRKAATRLRPVVERELAELAMPKAEFVIEFESAPEPAPTGADQIEMTVRTNPGQSRRPIREIASGGELSRIMLAMKTILAEHEKTTVLVFDEIDAKIGGRLGTVIGSKLRRLAGSRQVLCITHLPQIAAYGQAHFRIEKKQGGDSTAMEVKRLDNRGERIAELADMLAGADATATTRRQAEELLARATDAEPGLKVEAKPTPRRRARTAR
ncbi:MAG: DNA repair protein RecN [Phycisphaerales bacterium]